MTAYTGVTEIRVHPGIGVARVGQSVPAGDNDRGFFFLGPERPDEVPNPGDGRYKDSQGRIKRQAQRFRVFAYGVSGVLGEVLSGDTINGSTAVSIEWTAHLANMKAANYCFQGKYGFDPSQLRNSQVQANLIPAQRDQLIIDPGPQTIEGASQGPVELLDPTGSTIFGGITGPVPLSGLLAFDPPQGSPPPETVEVTYSPVTVSLGFLYTDSEGRLIVVGGAGEAGSATTPKVVISKVVTGDDPNPEYNGNSYFNNPGWYDDTAGGSIDAAVVDAAGTILFSTAGSGTGTGWLAVAPPKYAPASETVVSLLDLQLDLFPAADPYTGSGPLILAAGNSSGVAAVAVSADGSLTQLENLEPTSATAPDLTSAPAITVFRGTVYYASVQIDSEGLGIPMIGSAPSVAKGGFDFAAAATESTPVSTLLAPALGVFQDRLFYAVVGEDGTPYIGVSETGAAGSFTFSAAGSSDLASTAPALAAWNGQLYYGFGANPDLDPDGQPFTYLGSSADGTTGYDFQQVGDNAYTPYQPALAVYQGQLYLAFTGQDGLPYLGASGTAIDPAGFTLTQLSSSILASTGPALSAFNGTLYYALIDNSGDLVLGTSSDATQFSFTPSTTAVQAGVALAVREPVEFYRDVYPILALVTGYAWLNERAFQGHRPGTQGDFLRPPFLDLLAEPGAEGATARSFVFDFLRPPAQPTPDVPPPPASFSPSDVPPGGIQRGDLMPRLFGNGGSPEENEINGTNFPNQWLSLTNHQLCKFQRWVNGDFSTGTRGRSRWRDLPFPQALDFAALQPTVGGGFHPGIELTYLMHDPSFFADAFRFLATTVPGSIAAYMSVPWQGDFWSCNISWWPPARPDITVLRNLNEKPPLLTSQPWFRGNVIPPLADSIDSYEDGYQTMADHWSRLGLVVPVAEAHDQGEQVFHEVERDPTLDGPSLLATATGFAPNGSVLIAGTSGVTVGAAGKGDRWQLESYSASPSFFFIVSSGEQLVLTTVFASGSAVTLTKRASPGEDAQLWSYMPSGYPGVFLLVSKLNGDVLTVVGGTGGAQVVTEAMAAGAQQQWLLQAPPPAGS